MADTAGRITRLEVRCPYGTICEDMDTYLQHMQQCEVRVGQWNADKTYEGSRQMPSAVATSMPSLTSSPKPVACLCGRVFKNPTRVDNTDHTVGYTSSSRKRIYNLQTQPWTSCSTELKPRNGGKVVKMIVSKSGRMVGFRKCELRLAFCV
jgi:hypothetical protein